MKRVEQHSPPLSLDKTLLCDGLAWALFGIAKGEGQLWTQTGEDECGRAPSPLLRQKVLTLLLLFDRVLVHDLAPSTLFRIPLLEDEGLIEMAPQFEPLRRAPPLRRTKTLTIAGSRRRIPPSTSLGRTFQRVELYRPLVIDRMLATPMEFDRLAARFLRISLRRYYDDFLDFAISCLADDRAGWNSTLFAQGMPKDLLREIRGGLRATSEDMFTPARCQLIQAMLCADEIGAMLEIAADRKVSMATCHYGRLPQFVDMRRAGLSIGASDIPKSFAVVSGVLQEHGSSFPLIQDLRHLLRLRKSPHVRAFREQLRLFHARLLAGDLDGIQRVRTEVRSATRALERAAKWNRALRWLTYVSLPAGVAETLFAGAPIVGTSLALLSATGTVMMARREDVNDWVLFGA